LFGVYFSSVSEESLSETCSILNHHKVHESRKPALIQSIFSNCPPVINFATRSEQSKIFSSYWLRRTRWFERRNLIFCLKNVLLLHCICSKKCLPYQQ